MNDLAPFSYSTAHHIAVHGPFGYKQYQTYKPWLRDDFTFRCAYCLTRERWYPSPSGYAGFGIDHVVPKSADPTLLLVYGNLIYACNGCNSYKRAEILPIDPLKFPLASHLVVDSNGTITALTVEGRDFIDMFDLDSPGRTAIRADRLKILRMKRELPDHPIVDQVFRRAFGFPDDLPDLSECEPAGNTNAGSEERSHFARWQRGELPDVY